MIKAVIFDCFGVLTGDRWKEFVATLPEAQREPARELNRALDRGHIDLQQFSKAVGEMTGIKQQDVNSIINAEMHKNAELLEYIRGLKSKYKIGLLSNVSSDWITEQFLSREEAKLFDAIILSHQVGVTKPDPKIYKFALSKLDILAEEAVFVDDSPGNCVGARNIGMIGILYKDLPTLKVDLDKALTNS